MSKKPKKFQQYFNNSLPPKRCELCVAWTVCRSSGAGDIPTNIHGSVDCISVQKAIQKIILFKNHTGKE